MKYLFVGHSHLGAIAWGWAMLKPDNASAEFLNVKQARFIEAGDAAAELMPQAGKLARKIDRNKVRNELHKLARDAQCAVYMLSGHQHSSRAYAARGVCPDDLIDGTWARRLKIHYERWLADTHEVLPALKFMLLPPPPIESEAWIRANAGPMGRLINGHPLLPAQERLRLWDLQCKAIREAARRFSIPVHEAPMTVFSPTGFLAEDCRSEGDVTHASPAYGKRLLATLLASAEGDPAPVPAPAARLPATHGPYQGLAESAYWRKAVSDVTATEVDPVVAAPFRIAASDRVATAGSCFAQHISRRLMNAGFSFMQMEGNAGVDNDSYDFSARYGNVYTSRQLLQLFDRAFGTFDPTDKAWLRSDGRYCDPFRPRFNEAGFESAAAVQAETERHLAAVREMFRQLNVMVFTLGLTECFVRRSDGAVFPIAPGIAGGTFDDALYQFRNLSAGEVRSDLTEFVGKLRAINPNARLILTVSPVPLVATRSAKHVLVASTQSKAVLRVAAAEVEAALDGVFYFPSYEIITGPHAPSEYFDANRRTVAQSGVDHVMRVFMSHAVERLHQEQPESPDDDPIRLAEALTEAICDEELNDAGL